LAFTPNEILGKTQIEAAANVRDHFRNAMCKKTPVALIRLSQGSIQSSRVKQRDTSRLNKIASHVTPGTEHGEGKGESFGAVP